MWVWIAVTVSQCTSIAQVAARCSLVQLDATFAANHPTQRLLHDLQDENFPHGLGFSADNLAQLRARWASDDCFEMMCCNRHAGWTFTASDFATNPAGRFYFAMTNTAMQDVLNARLDAAHEAYTEHLEADPLGTYADYVQHAQVTYARCGGCVNVAHIRTQRTRGAVRQDVQFVARDASRQHLVVRQSAAATRCGANLARVHVIVVSCARVQVCHIILPSVEGAGTIDSWAMVRNVCRAINSAVIDA
jgi:hypothetical protein